MTVHEIRQPDCDNADKVLDGAKGALAKVLVVGETESGQPYYASTTSHKPTLLWMIELLRHKLVSGDFDD